jgi:hypothetical protein
MLSGKRDQGKIQASVLVLALTCLAGCGTETSTIPVTLGSNDEAGEIQYPGSRSRIPAPGNLQAAYNGSHTVRVTWDIPGDPYVMIILRDGVEVGRLPGLSGEFTDDPELGPGVYSYTACFARGDVLGPEATTDGFMPDLTRELTDRNPDPDIAD